MSKKKKAENEPNIAEKETPEVKKEETSEVKEEKTSEAKEEKTSEAKEENADEFEGLTDAEKLLLAKEERFLDKVE